MELDERSEQARYPRRTAIRIVTALAVVLVALGAGASRGAHAQTEAPEPEDQPPVAAPAESEPARWAVQPSGPDGPGNRDWFVYTLDPGAVFGDTVAISNLSDRPIDFIIYPADVDAVQDVGGLAPQREDETPTDVGSWVELGATRRTVEPGTRIDVPFSVTVPEDAEPGDHVGAILAIDAAEAVIDPDSGEDLGLQVRQRIGARVYVRVGGEQAPALSVTKLEVSHDDPVLGGADATIDWEITNTGNLRLTPTATMKIKGFLGRTVKEVPLPAIPELLPGGNFIGTSIVEDLPPLERFTVEIDVEAIETDTSASRSFWPTPWLLLLLLLPIGWFAYHWLRRRWTERRERRPPEDSPPPPSQPKELAGV